MVVIRNLYFLFVFVLFCFSVFVTEVHADTHTAASCAYSDVSAAVAAASAGDTVSVPAGACTWNTRLTITKGVNLIGAGVGNTVITNGRADHGTLIAYEPSNYSANDPFRVSGFTIDLGNNGFGIVLGISSKTAPFTVQTKIRVDHNRFTNAATLDYQSIWNYGGMHGVVDNNIFDGVWYPIRNSPQVGGSNWWDNFTYTFGAAGDNLYFEDNIFSDIVVMADAQFSGRYAFRYNTISVREDAFPLFDMHGNSPSGGRTGATAGGGMYSTFGGELYGNRVNASGRQMCFLNQRGGKVLGFYNSVAASSLVWFKETEEYPDSEEPTTNPQPQHVSDSYFWNNREGYTGTLGYAYRDPNGMPGDIPLADRDFFFQRASFNGASGVGCGTLASRPVTCTTGVGYWATNQSCSDLAGMVGANPTTPISGTLYKCTAPNTWTAFYTPYTYPHPLRAQTPGQTTLNPPQNLQVRP
jgi:hypothetical protein